MAETEHDLEAQEAAVDMAFKTGEQQPGVVIGESGTVYTSHKRTSEYSGDKIGEIAGRLRTPSYPSYDEDC